MPPEDNPAEREWNPTQEEWDAMNRTEDEQIQEDSRIEAERRERENSYIAWPTP